MRLACQASAHTLLLAGLTFAVSPSLSAAPLSFDPEDANSRGSISCAVQTDKIDRLGLRNGMVVINGNVITVKSSPDGFLPPQAVLNGVIIRAEADTDSSSPKITGIAFFLSGAGLPAINDAGAEDVVFRHDGAISGRLVGINGDKIDFARKDGSHTAIDVSTVKFVRSPRALLFRIPLTSSKLLPESMPFQASADNATFTPTTAKRSLPLSSIIPKPPGDAPVDTTAGGGLERFGDGTSRSGDHELPAETDYDEIPTVFRWQKAGIRTFP